jgi:protein ImuB
MGTRFVSIWLPYLPTDWFTLRKPELKSIPFVLTAPSHGRMVITAANPVAQRQGIHPGDVLADARAIFPGLQAFDDKPALVPQLLQRIAEWCIRFTPRAGTDNRGVILDASGCTHLWGGEEAYINDIAGKLRAKGYTARVALAGTIGAAWAVARFGKPGVVPQEQVLTCLKPLPPAALRLDLPVIERLQKLGLRQVGDFISMPRPALRRRFGPDMLLRVAQALGEVDEAIQPVYPPEPFAERLPCLEPIITLVGIEIALERLLDALCTRLQKEGKGLREAHFRGFRTDSGVQGIQIGTARPSHNRAHLFHLFQTKLSSLEPAPGIELFVLEATRVEDHQSQQESFWKGTAAFGDASLAELLDRLSNKLGAQSIRRFLPDEHWWPERSVRPASSLEEETAVPWNDARPRPVHLLPSPEPIEVTAPIPDYPPMLFRYKGILHKVAKADGPERIEKEWWLEDGQHRDYYCVEDEAGQRYWLFRLGHYEAEKKAGWYLHGFFA